MKETKLKNLKYEIPGSESKRLLIEAVAGFLLVPAILLIIGLCIIFKKSIDEVGWRVVIAVIGTVAFLLLAFKYRKK